MGLAKVKCSTVRCDDAGIRRHEFLQAGTELSCPSGDKCCVHYVATVFGYVSNRFGNVYAVQRLFL